MAKAVLSTQQRLQAAQRGGNLTLPELAGWFGRSYQTVRGWIENGREPSGAPLDVEHIMSLLGLLETLIQKKQWLPVPRMARDDRSLYLKKLRKAVMP